MSIRKVPDSSRYFQYFNANPKNNRTSDCVIRAIACVTDQSWETVFSDLAQLALKHSRAMNDPYVYDKYLRSLGFVKERQPGYTSPISGQKFKWQAFMWAHQNPSIKCVAHVGGHHLTAIKDGKIWDIWDCSDGCVGNYWAKG